MKKIFDNINSRIRQNWSNVMHSTKRKMSQGAQFIYKIITSAHGDNWRRKDHKKPKKKD
jgi:hypothetical protein